MTELFRVNPDYEFANNFVTAFGLANLEDKKFFCKRDLLKINTLATVIDFAGDLSIYYYPFKLKNYLNNMTLQQCITILRHIVKLFNKKLNRKEVVKRNKKEIYYQIVDIVCNIKINSESKIIDFT